MKKIIVFSMMLLAVCVSANAQQQMKVLKTDGTVTEFNVEDVTKVYFEESSSDEISLAGTSWKIISATEDVVGYVTTFKADGNVIFTPTIWAYAKWSITDNNKLKIIVGSGYPDDYMYGEVSVNGETATYNYSWYDYNGKWGGDGNYSMTLQKQ